MQTKVAINVPDLHIPWHDIAYCEILLKVIEYVYKNYDLEEINFLGDVADFFNFKLWPKAPREMGMRTYAKHEIFLVNNFLDEVDKRFPDCKKRFCSGNHEDRLLRYITKKAPELYEDNLVQEYFKLDERGYEFFEFGRNQLAQCLNTNLYLRHRPFDGGMHCCVNSIKKKFINLSFGDTHRLQWAKLKTGDLEERSCFSLGWGGDDRADVFHYMDTDDWSQGFQIVFQTGEGKTDWFQNLIEVKTTEDKKNKYCIFDGHFYISEIKPIQKPEDMFSWQG